MDKLSRDEVLHVCKLAKIKIEEKDMEKFQVHLKQLMNEVVKINDIEIENEEILIAPWSSNTILRSDEVGEMLSKEDVLKNAPRKSGSYVEVPVVIND